MASKQTEAASQANGQLVVEKQASLAKCWSDNLRQGQTKPGQAKLSWS